MQAGAPGAGRWWELLPGQGAGGLSRTGLGQHRRQAVREARGRGVPLPHPARCPHHLQLHGMGPPSACRPAAPPFLLFHSPAPHPATGTPDKVRYPSTPTTEDEAAAPRRSFWWPALCTVFAGSRAGPPPGDNWGLGPAYTQLVLEVTETFSPTGEQPPHGAAGLRRPRWASGRRGRHTAGAVRARWAVSQGQEDERRPGALHVAAARARCLLGLSGRGAAAGSRAGGPRLEGGDHLGPQPFATVTLGLHAGPLRAQSRRGLTTQWERPGGDGPAPQGMTPVCAPWGPSRGCQHEAERLM